VGLTVVPRLVMAAVKTKARTVATGSISRTPDLRSAADEDGGLLIAAARHDRSGELPPARQ